MPKVIFEGYYSSLWVCVEQKGIAQRTEYEYKQGKHYRYFTDNFISEVSYSNINDE